MLVLDSLRLPPGLRVLVTAGASGVGAAVARAFSEAGAHVHVCDIDRTALGRLANEAPAITGSLADAAVPGDVDLVFDDVLGTLGGLDVLVTSAGIAGPTAAIEAIDLAQWERSVAVNLTSHFLFARRAVPLLKASRSQPSVVVVGAMTDCQEGAFRSPQAATHAAVVGLARSLAAELAPQGVRVNAVLPAVSGLEVGRVALRGSAAGPGSDAMRDEQGRRRALQRMATAADVAAITLFLASPAARHVTGQTMCVQVRADDT